MLQPGRNYSFCDYRFGFNGQEKVDEIAGTGNHNTALFWEYDTRLGRRWNIDPIIKPWESPYASFSNNPISRIDPKGDSDYGVDKSGNIKLEKKTKDKSDFLFVKGTDGTLDKNKSTAVGKGILNNVHHATDNQGFKYDYMQINNDKTATKLFEFLATNTSVEWGQVKFGSKSNFVSTTHRPTEEAGAGMLTAKLLTADKFSVREHIHSHPSGNPPSGFDPKSSFEGDRGNAEFMHKTYPKANYKLKVYNVPDNKYIEYNYKQIITK